MEEWKNWVGSIAQTGKFIGGQPLQAGGRLMSKSGITDAPYVGIEALRCGGEVRIIGSKLGPTHFRPKRVFESIELCEIGLLSISDSEILGALDLTHLQVNGFEENRKAGREGRQGVWIEQCKVQGDHSKFSGSSGSQPSARTNSS